MDTVQHHARGFTILEIQLAAVIFAGILAALLLGLLMGRSSYVSAEAYVQLQQEARRAFDGMARELRGAGQVNNNVTILDPGVQRLDFQIARSFDISVCGGVCWGTDAVLLPNGWLHYVLDATNPQNARLMRCVTANRLDPMPVDFAGCRVLANSLTPNLANSSFMYNHATRTILVKLQTSVTSQQLPGGSMVLSPTPLTLRVRLRNTL